MCHIVSLASLFDLTFVDELLQPTMDWLSTKIYTFTQGSLFG